MVSRNVERHALNALMDIYKAGRSWDGWNSDGVTLANSLINDLLQLRNSQEPAVWHPSTTLLFPDLASKYTTAMLSSARTKLNQLMHKISMMQKQIDRMLAAADELTKLIPPAASAQSAEPLAFGSLQKFSDWAHVNAVEFRSTHAAQLLSTIECLEQNSEAPPDALDSDRQMTNLSIWLHAPGLKESRLSDTCPLTVADFDDMLRAELGIDEI
ncbi:hypothetical protein DL89DRAFT_268553 [Linderina pennispora]|uniref:Uncharacterized protein n=1 Tax=Linderina pennispora TaxID=61395 RepID=A0A1Y1W6A2_9FUNG|nr:uncharacterized protein DL89DRAFT_268553 [Linderina pennispora]ORX68776.1 hypothetical protein DL89DRAFT_268553 [Linderina pennispora]